MTFFHPKVKGIGVKFQIIDTFFLQLQSLGKHPCHTSRYAGGFADINNDGCWDLIRVPLDAPTEIFMASCSDGNWLDISLFEQGEPAIGSKIHVQTSEKNWQEWYTAGGRSFATYLPFIKHFGLGDIEEVTLQITWPNGEQQEMFIDEVNQHIQIER